MASLTKELSKSISGVATATTASVQGLAATITSVSSITVNTVDGIGDTVKNLTATSNIYSADLVEDAKASAKEAKIKRDIKLKALEAVSKNQEVLGKAEEAMAKSFISELMEDLS